MEQPVLRHFMEIKMEIELISEELFTVAANGKQVSGMRVVSEWEGLKKLTDSKGNTLIVTSESGTFSKMFEEIFGKKINTAMIVMGSPDLIAALSPDKP